MRIHKYIRRDPVFAKGKFLTRNLKTDNSLLTVSRRELVSDFRDFLSVYLHLNKKVVFLRRSDHNVSHARVLFPCISYSLCFCLVFLNNLILVNQNASLFYLLRNLGNTFAALIRKKDFSCSFESSSKPNNFLLLLHGSSKASFHRRLVQNDCILDIITRIRHDRYDCVLSRRELLEADCLQSVCGH